MVETYRVYKYPVSITDRFTLWLPEGAEVLDVQAQAQGSEAALWALVNPDAPTVERAFRLVGTGHPIDPQDRWHIQQYVGTFQLIDGALVYHLFALRGA